MWFPGTRWHHNARDWNILLCNASIRNYCIRHSSHNTNFQQVQTAQANQYFHHTNIATMMTTAVNTLGFHNLSLVCRSGTEAVGRITRSPITSSSPPGNIEGTFGNTPDDRRKCSNLVRWIVPVRKVARNTGETLSQPSGILFSKWKTWTSNFHWLGLRSTGFDTWPKRPLTEEH